MSFRTASFPISIAAVLALGVGLVASGLLAMWLAGIENNEANRTFQKQAEVELVAVQDGLHHAADALLTVHNLFATVGTVSREQFHAFTQPLLTRYPYTRAFTFQRRDRGVDYIETMSGNAAAFGPDAAAPDQEAVMREAAATGRPTATSLFPLRNAPERRGFSLLMPVYGQGATLAEADPRRLASGYISALFDAGALFGPILERTETPGTPALDVRIYAGKGRAEQDLAFKKTGVRQKVPLLAHGLFDDRPAYLARTFEAVGHQWQVSFTAPPGTIRDAHPYAMAVLLGGGLISLLAAACLQVLALRNARLARTNALLTDDVAARREAERGLRRLQGELRELAAHQEQLREDERKRIAREVHDELGQNLLALRLDLSMMDARTATLDTALNDRVRVVLGQIDMIVKSIRGIINSLRPPVLDLGLQAALEWLAAQFRERHGIACTLTIDRCGLDAALDDERSTAIFRIVQESLNNVARHARASRVEIGLRRHDGRLFVSVADNGIGSFPGDRRKPRSFGLLEIRERTLALGGEFRIEGMAGKGTTVMFSVMVEPPATPVHVPDRRNS